MVRARLILCPVDFSDHARRALEHAVGLAALHQAQLVVHTAIDPLLAEAAAARVEQDYVRDTRTELAAFTGQSILRKVEWAPSPRLVVTIGHAASQILEVAAFYQADLIVMGAQGLGAIEKPVFGSTTDDVLRHTTTPVLVVPRQGKPRLAFTREGPRFAPGRVLAAVDLREGSSAVAGAGAELAGLFDVPLVLAHAVTPVEAPARWSQCSADATRVHSAVAEVGLDALADGLMVPVEPVVLTGHPAEAIAEAAASRDAGLIVMGIGSAQGGPQRFGSTAYRVLSFTTVPVLALPPDSADGARQVGRSLGKEAIA
jgi:nucleotide-binding universal stress UspA family protein